MLNRTLGKYHPTTLSLKRTGHRHEHRLVDLVATTLDDDHRSIVEISNPLVVSLSRLDHSNLKCLARQILRSQRGGDLIQIDHLDIVQLGDLVEIEVPRQKLPVEMLGQKHQLHIDRLTGKLGQLRVVHHEVDAFGRSDPIENVQPAPASDSLELVGTIGDPLKLHQNKSRHDQAVVEDVRLGKLGQPAVDDAARVENQWFDPLKVPRELHIRNHETKVILRLQQNTHAGITKGDQDPERNVRSIRIDAARIVDERSEREHQEIGENNADQKTKVDRRNNLNPLARDEQIQKNHPAGDQEHPGKDQIRRDRRALLFTGDNLGTHRSG